MNDRMACKLLSPSCRRLSSRINSWQEELSKSTGILDEKGLQAELSQAIKTLQIKVGMYRTVSKAICNREISQY